MIPNGQPYLFGAMALLFIFAAGCSAPEHENGARKAATATFFTEITEQARLNFVHDAGVDGSYFMPEIIGAGAAFLDYDQDGDLDIYLINSGSHRNNKGSNDQTAKNRLFRQESNGVFADVTATSGLGDTGYGMGVACGDVDNDGDVDVYVTNYGPDALYRNNGDGTFMNISQAAGIANPRWGSSAIFLDYNRDGFLDIYVANYLAYDPSHLCMDRAGRPEYCGPEVFSGVPDVLYRNNGDGTFTDVSVQSGIAQGRLKGLGVLSFDYNGDHYPDIYVANDGEPNHLWINQRNGTFQDQALKLGAAVNSLGRPEAGMGLALGDVDNDDDFDLFVTHLRFESNTLYRNAGAHGFQDDSAPSGLAGPTVPYTGFGAGFLDYDHDGDLDLAVVNGRIARGPLLTNNDPPGYWDAYAEPNMLFENEGGGIFREVGNQAPAFCGRIENSRGLAFGDVDNDGDIDLLVTNDGGRARLYRNDVKNKGHWLLIRAIDPKLNRDAIGAQVTVVVGNQKISRLMAPGYSFLCSNDPRSHFGLGSASAVDHIIVQWPDGQNEIFPGVAADQIMTLQKGQTRERD
ncbi:MAG: CRTAC1 family protein [candidate division KSB1 bacterium]|nr:CRTAC1 family protein [candidate division KSB1 bacterium]MDZ7367954.1 CRTAC1 family protein [candidate division KSB1 bacterium]MDZ7405577.1 CRTAC1 family protein [candidate division KSB1 bacterium]